MAGNPNPYSAVPGRGNQQGNIILELALILPLFLLILAGILDLGTLFWEKQILTNATREGARAAVRANADGTRQYSQQQAKGVACGYLYNFNLKGSTGTALVTQSSPPPNDSYTLNEGTCNYVEGAGTPKQVTIEFSNIPVQLLLLPALQGMFGGGWSDTYLLNARTTMAAEWTS